MAEAPLALDRDARVVRPSWDHRVAHADQRALVDRSLTVPEHDATDAAHRQCPAASASARGRARAAPRLDLRP
jgi:hypothetical protein